MGAGDDAVHGWRPDESRLVSWLADAVPDFRGPVEIERLSGGQSNPTFLLRGAEMSLILRSKPRGPVLPSAHAVDREFRVLDALWPTDVPVPRPRALCTDEGIIGTIFYVMDFVPGRIFWDPRLPDLTRDERAAIFDSMNDVIARIHAVDIARAGLESHGRPGNYVERQVARWTRQYLASQTGTIPAMDWLIDWLPRNLPPDNATGLVHGDYRLDNVLIHPTEPRVVAVLDWELSTLGDPIADFAYHMMSWRLSPDLFRGLAGVDFAALGIPDEEAYLARYLQRTGATRTRHWEFYLVLSMFRIAAIMQGIARRRLDGSAAGTDSAEVGAKARPIAEIAVELARGVG